MAHAEAIADFTGNGTYESSDTPSSVYDVEPPLHREVYTVMVPALIGVITFIGLIGNSIVVYVIVCKGHLKTVTNYYIVNLAITDIFFLVFCAPFTAAIYALPSWIFGRFMCKFVFYMMQVTATATCATLTAMSVDRYYAITDPLKALKTRTPRVAIIVSVCIWTISALLAIPIAVYFDLTPLAHNPALNSCWELWPHPWFYTGYAVYSFVALYVIPLTIIIVCYSIVLNRLWKSVAPTEEMHAPVHLRMLMQKRRVTRMILAVVVAFAACWILNYIMALWQRFAGDNFPRDNKFVLVLQIFAHMTAYANSCVNPFVYAFMGGNFRKQMVRAFPFLTGKKSSTTDGPSGSLIKSKSTQV